MQASMPKAVGDDDDLMDDSDTDPGLDDSDDLRSAGDEQGIDGDSDDGLSLVEGSDNEDLISLDGDVPDGLIDYDGSDADDNEDDGEWQGVGGGEEKSNKRKRTDEDKKRRKKLKSLPTFASYEDYAKMIEDGPEDDI